jgi:hypothetical protein
VAREWVAQAQLRKSGIDALSDGDIDRRAARLTTSN